MDDISIYIAAVSATTALIALWLSFRGSSRTRLRDTAENATQLTRMETTLEGVRKGVDDIHGEMRTQQKQINDVSERVARVEESAKEANRRLDVLEERDCE